MGVPIWVTSLGVRRARRPRRSVGQTLYALIVKSNKIAENKSNEITYKDIADLLDCIKTAIEVIEAAIKASEPEVEPPTA